MIDLVKKIFGKTTTETPMGQEGERSRDISVATCALLIEMSNIDGEFSESERESIISVLKKNYDLSDEDAIALIEASSEEVKGSIDLWQFTNLINQNYSMEEKLRIIETVWRIAYTDGKLDKHEDYLVHKLAKLLRLTHKQLIEAKLKVKESMEDFFLTP
jgi:uncharacterized tellurite resistance protein B-like protein